MKTCCPWARDGPLIIEYHDMEWGVSIHDDRLLFEFLILESAQAGLRWTIILKKRDNYRKAFDNFQPEKVADYNEQKIEELLNNPGIVRNRLKIRATVANARAVLKLRKEFGNFDSYIWQFVSGKTIQNKWKTLAEVPSSSPESEKMSKDLKKRISNSWGLPSATDICKRWGWLTTIWWIVSAIQS